MLMIDIIAHKRDGKVLTQEELNYFVTGVVDGSIPDYQSAALLMAIYWRGLSPQERFHLTSAMVGSGSRLSLAGIQGIKVDKHSTGGVADTTSIILVPWVGSAGVHIAKMSGRGLGHTGGTIDKLESIPGFKASYSVEDLVNLVQKTGCAIVEQTGEIAPADKRIYALRDVTGTTASIGLIASSVMSKKLACGADRILLDVKTGRGAFLPRWEDSLELAQTMVQIGESSKIPTVAILTNMDQPLGTRIGNALEIQEAIEVLSGKKKGDLVDLCLYLGAELLLLAELVPDHRSGEKLLQEKLDRGAAIEMFKKMIAAQGGDARVVDHPDRLTIAQSRANIIAKTSGYIESIETGQLGQILVSLGVGRTSKEKGVDPSVGVILYKRCGDPIQKGESIGEVLSHTQDVSEYYARDIAKLYIISQSAPSLPRLIRGRIDHSGTEIYELERQN
jgi:pyrimidine-nucleoside phosphorylase